MDTLSVLVLLSFVYTIFVVLIAIESFRQKRKKYLFFIIPTILILSIYSWNVVYNMLGYPTKDISDLMAPKVFSYVFHFAKDDKVVYLVAMPQNTRRPRIYELPVNEAEERKALQEAKKRAGRGKPTVGMVKDGVLEFLSEGDHTFDQRRAALPPKEGEGNE